MLQLFIIFLWKFIIFPSDNNLIQYLELDVNLDLKLSWTASAALQLKSAMFILGSINAEVINLCKSLKHYSELSSSFSTHPSNWC